MPVLSSLRVDLRIVAILAVLFVLCPARVAGMGSLPSAAAPEAGPEATAPPESRARLEQGVLQLLDLFDERGFSLLEAWRQMRASDDPAVFDRSYPGLSRELDFWASSNESRLGPGAADLDLTFLVERLGPVVLDPMAPPARRDNALASLCLMCLMEEPRCDAARLHRLLASVVAADPSPLRKTEALRWWRRSGGFVDESLLRTVLASPAGAYPALRAEVARTLFAVGSRRSLEAQRLLAGTSGLPADPSGEQVWIACTAMRHLALARYEEAAPDLIRALEDPSAEVRACAADSLADLSGEDFGFDPGADGAANAVAIARWRAWWSARDRGPATH